MSWRTTSQPGLGRTLPPPNAPVTPPSGPGGAISALGVAKGNVPAATGGGAVAWGATPLPPGLPTLLLSSFNPVGNGIADDTIPVTNWLNALNAQGGGRAQAGLGIYKITAALPGITVPCQISGEVSSVQGNGSPTVFSFAAGLPGLQFTGPSEHSIVENLRLLSADSTNGQGAANSDHGISNIGNNTHGLIVRQVDITGFGGDGIHIAVGSGPGNAIGSLYENVRVGECNGNGVLLSGQNASVSTLTNCDVANVGLFAYNMGAPGCVLINCQSAYASQNPGRTVTDAVTTSGSNVLTSATADFTSADLAMVITGTNIPSNTAVSEVVSATEIRMSNNASASGANGTLTVLNGGAVQDTSLGNGYINFYAESGLGANASFPPPATQGWWIQGGWTSAWIANTPTSGLDVIMTPSNLAINDISVSKVVASNVEFANPSVAGHINIFPGVYSAINFTDDSGSGSYLQSNGQGCLETQQLFKATAQPTYSAAITPNAQQGPWQTITVTNATAFTINAPSSPPNGSYTAELTIEVYNNSGTTMGAITWASAFNFAGQTWTNPATGKRCFARFEWNGTEWVCTNVAPADY